MSNPLGIPKGVEETLHRAVVRCQEYPDIRALELTEAVAKQLAVPKEYLLFGNGASEIFMGIMHALKPENVLISGTQLLRVSICCRSSGK